MRLLIKAIWLYQLVFLAGGGLLLYISLSTVAEAQRGGCSYPEGSTDQGQPTAGHPAYPCVPSHYALFVSVSAFANSGATTEPSSLEVFHTNALMLVRHRHSPPPSQVRHRP